MVWPTLGSRTAKDQNRTLNCVYYVYFLSSSLNGNKITLAKPNVPISGQYCTSQWPWPLNGLQRGHYMVQQGVVATYVTIYLYVQQNHR